MSRQQKGGVDARVKRGHDDQGRLMECFVTFLLCWFYCLQKVRSNEGSMTLGDRLFRFIQAW